MRRFKNSHGAFIGLSALLLLVALAANAAGQGGSASRTPNPIPSYPFTTPVFGLTTAPDGSLLVADAGAGIVELRKGEGSLIAPLPGVTDVAAVGRGNLYAVTGGNPDPTATPIPTAQKLYRITGGKVQLVADLLAFERLVNPDGGAIDSNPFDVAVLSGNKVLVADAAGNSLLIVDQKGNVDWVATLPTELVSTANVKSLVGCPESNAPLCFLPPMLPAEPVVTSVAVGPDGAYYVGELKGFPAPTGESRVWRIEPGTLHAQCGTSPACTVVADGFTSIIDLSFGPDGSLYVVELDEASWFALETGAGVGGTVNRCDLSTGTCSEVATGLPIPVATTVGSGGTVYAAILALVPNAARVIPIQ